MLKKVISNENKIRGQIIKKSLELYFAVKPPKISYNKKGEIRKRYYNKINFSKDFGVSLQTISKWEKTGIMAKWSKIRLVMMGILPERMW
jgi:DNA-binding transcriptional regulator YiaG